MINRQVNVLAGYEPAPLENWYRKKYFTNEIDISGSGVEEYSYEDIKDIADFDFAEMDRKKIEDGETVGSLQVRQIIADKFAAGDPETVMVANGSNEALQLVVRSILNEGDEVITHGPCYHCHDKIASSMGCVVRKWSLGLNSHDEQDLEKLKNLISDKTKALVLNFPNNPTGISISQSTLNSVVQIARENDLILVWDAAFQELTYETPPLRDPLFDYPKTISIGTFSKAYGAPGLRFGWLIAEPEVIAACIRQKDYGNLFVAPLVEFVATKMLENIDKFSSPRLEQATRNRKVVESWVKEDSSHGEWRNPDGGVCGLLKLPEIHDDVAFCNNLLERYGVLLVPGSCFDISGHVRLGFGGGTGNLTNGLERLDAFLKETIE